MDKSECINLLSNEYEDRFSQKPLSFYMDRSYSGRFDCARFALRVAAVLFTIFIIVCVAVGVTLIITQKPVDLSAGLLSRGDSSSSSDSFYAPPKTTPLILGSRKKFPSNYRKFGISDLFSSTPIGKLHYFYAWTPDGSGLVHQNIEGIGETETLSIITTDSSEERKFIDAKQIPSGFNAEKIKFSPSGKYAALSRQVMQGFRHSKDSIYRIARVVNGKLLDLVQVGPTGNGTEILQEFSWNTSPDSDSFAFVSSNTLFYQEKPEHVGKAKQLSQNGSDDVRYGISDWLYEEDVIAKSTAHWWSPGGKFLSYIKFDDTEVNKVWIKKYRSKQYPDYMSIPYPKAGVIDQPKVKLYLWNRETAQRVVISPPDELNNQSYYIFSVSWLRATNDREEKLVTVWANRKQTLLYFTICDEKDCVMAYEQSFSIGTRRLWATPLDFENLPSSKTGFFAILPVPYSDGNIYNHVAHIKIEKDGLGRVSATHGGPYDVQSITGYDPDNDVITYTGMGGGIASSRFYRINRASSKEGAIHCLSCALPNCESTQISVSPLGSRSFVLCREPFKDSRLFFMDVANPHNAKRLRGTEESTSSLTFDPPTITHETIRLPSGVDAHVGLMMPPRLDPNQKYPLLLDVSSQSCSRSSVQTLIDTLGNLIAPLKAMEITKSSGYDSSSVEGSSPGSGSGTVTGPPQRKADLAYNHLQLAVRPGQCRAARSRVSVTSNHFLLQVPTTMKFASFRLDFEEEVRNKGWSPAKKEKMTNLFSMLFAEWRKIFPTSDASLVFNGTDMIYTPPTHSITPSVYKFQNNRGATFKGRPARATFARCTITPIGISSLSTVQVDDEANRCALMQFLDCILSQEHRFDLTGRAARFIQHGHSLFKIPRTDAEKRLDVRRIGKGEEVWLGLHAAVKCDGEELMLNADTSGSIFKARRLSLIELLAQVIRGYTLSLDKVDFENLTIDDRGIDELERVLKGSKVMLNHPNGTEKVKKFDGISRRPADREFFEIHDQNNRPVRVSVAEFFLQHYGVRLQCPKFPCLKFWSKTTKSPSYLPIEFFTTMEEPTRFKGKLTDQQLDVFVKAVCQNPKEKKSRIERFCTKGGEYLGDTAVMREWNVSLDRKMVEVKDCPVLPLPHIEMPASAPQIAVNVETGEWKLTETIDGKEYPIKPVELNGATVLLFVMFVNHDAQREDKIRCDLLTKTLTSYGVKVDGDIYSRGTPPLTMKAGRSFQTDDTFFKNFFLFVMDKVARRSREAGGEKFVPLTLWVFNRRDKFTYGAIKRYSDVVYGVPSQCTVRKTYEKLVGNAITNTSAQNLLLKILSKTGSVPYRLSAFAHKNVERLHNPEDPVLIIGIDVSHPGKEERFDAIKEHEQKTGRNTEQANKFRGQHQKLPTARPAGKTLFAELPFHDCPRSVVAVVGTLDIKGSHYGVSARVQRLGQEETVNMVEPFKERLQEFNNNVGRMPKHIIVYRDGVSDSQIKKIAYEELESLERAIESFGLENENEKITITYITAAKRHHTRFFRSNLDEMPENTPHQNCPPGTLVEEKIVSRNKWDFYLQSHYGNLGTALPTRYTVVRNDWNVSAAFVQTIVFAHCFGNVRCPRPLSIPVPLHYAHLAAKRSKVLFDHFKDNACDEYYHSKEDLVREELERQAVNPHKNIKDMMAMHYA